LHKLEELNTELAETVKMLCLHRTMSYFSSALQKVIEARFPGRGGQTQLAREVGLEQATMSRYINAESRPDVNVLEQICAALPRAQRAELAIAYLRDDLPPSAEECVQLVNLCNSGARTKPIPETRERLPKKLRDAFIKLEEDAARSPLVADAVFATVALLRGERL
jgi:transcriptional regulator with XRE-family HTH domain